ncbi:MAG TPA: enolase C-terminal domain-like protein [Gaiellaceae bacterium]|jgi:L-alanine-DL-glutamate epimerase-like enolase superfamily enzyme|nr:enolase C-terminal domain-like protein [Gaiellaceae bacterium]
MTAVARERVDVAVERLDVAAYAIPTDEPESDATFDWDSTTIVVVVVHAGGETGLGYTYAPAAAARLVDDELADLVEGADALALGQVWLALGARLRNAGRPGLGFCALSAVDVALWDLKARLLGLPLADLLGRAHDAVPVYGSGGFTSYDLPRLQAQLAGWVEEGIPRVKMKVGREPTEDPARLAAARQAVGPATELFVDANGALTRKEALAWAERFAGEWGVSWFEEPVSSADLEGLRLLRDRGPAGLDVAAGEYAYVPADFRNLLAAGAVDCLQADVTRCGGITGILHVGALSQAHGIDLSGHCAPAVSAHALCAVHRLRHLEWFHDHVRIEEMLFEGVPSPAGGFIRPDEERPGLGLELRREDGAPYLVYEGRR